MAPAVRRSNDGGAGVRPPADRSDPLDPGSGCREAWCTVECVGV